MKKFAFICAILLTSMVCGAQEFVNCSCNAVIRKDGQKTENWYNSIDLMNIVTPVGIQFYKSLVLFPVNYSDAKWTGAQGAQTSAVSEALAEFPEIFHEAMQTNFPKIAVTTVEDSESADFNKYTLGVCIHIDEFNVSARSMKASVVVFNLTKVEFFDFTSTYTSENNGGFKEVVLDNLELLTTDLSSAFSRMVQDGERAAKEAERAAREAAKGKK